MKVRVVGEDERERFNSAAAATSKADVLQSWEWGEIKRHTGWQPLRFIVEDGDDVRAACSVLRLRALRGVPPLLYAPRGPVLDFADGEALHALLEAIRARAGDAFMLKLDPPVEVGSPAVDALVHAGLRRVSSGAFGGVQPVAIMELDLDRSLEDVLAGFKSKWRYNIRLAERKGVTVREADEADLERFHALYAETAKRDGFTGRGLTYFRTMWTTLRPRAMAKMWIAEFEGTPLSSIICTMFGSRMVYNYGGSSNEHRNVMPNHLIQWTAIQWAHANGYKTYDFRGVSPMRNGEAVEQHIAGLNRFKEGFGARYVEYAGEFDAGYRRAWYLLWEKGAPRAIALRSKLKGGAREAAD
ncbi:MAG TPA: peptidoglycan bridge formation glycyltransferase FemA/FemB family protein [Actinomycetota bacterium]|nr:peptidoglycan bridge formation glycyltransferase FemA/FemB family protein [Actinomycetota bacterium]